MAEVAPLLVAIELRAMLLAVMALGCLSELPFRFWAFTIFNPVDPRVDRLVGRWFTYYVYCIIQVRTFTLLSILIHQAVMAQDGLLTPPS